MIEYNDEPKTCGCCGGDIPAGKIKWIKSGECPGSVNHYGSKNLCGAIVEILPPSKKWLRERESVAN